MQWHIMTGSKGGIGKTLQTLLLLEYHLHRKPDEGVLVLDLNAMNTDTAAILLHNRNGPIIPIELNKKRRINFQQSFSLFDNEDACYFGVGWPSNPFQLYEYEYNSFADLLDSIKNEIGKIAEELEIPTLKHVIIDSNYHFCSLFPSKDEHYKEYQEILKEDNISIWFLWIYRQLYKLIEESNNDETEILRRTANAIERVFKQNGIGPIIHTYTPIGLLPNQSGQGNFLSRWLRVDTIRRDQDHTIEKLINLESLSTGKYVKFNDWIKVLKETSNNIENKDPHLLLVNILKEAVQRLSSNSDELSLPINVFPLSVYQSALEGYTDKARKDLVANLRNFSIYTNFAKLLKRKERET